MSEDKDTNEGESTRKKIIDRKVKSNGKEKKRKRKRTDQSEDTAEYKKSQKQSDEIENDDNELQDEEVKKPKEPSKRQLKREKIEKQNADLKVASKLEAAKKALNYISKWKHAKSDWKFEKLRQIWLMDNLLDEKLVPDDMFPIVMEYFEGSKGMARQQLVKKMMEVIKKVEQLNEADEEDEEKKESTNTSEYQRARQILQALPTEG